VKKIILFFIFYFTVFILFGQGLFNNGAYISVSSTAHVTIIGTNGNLTNNTVTSSLINNGNIYLTGNWLNNGTYTSSGGGIVTFNGNLSKTLDGASTHDFYKLKIDKTAVTNLLTILKPVKITNMLILSNGVISTDATNLLNISDNATVSTDGSNNIAGSRLSFVDGPMIKTGNDLFTFPVGDIRTVNSVLRAVWAPLKISAPVTTGDIFKCEYLFTMAPNNLGPGPMCDPSTLHHTSGIEYWDINRDNGTSSPDITLFWKPLDGLGIPIDHGIDPAYINDIVAANWENCPATGTNKWVSHVGPPDASSTATDGFITVTGFPAYDLVTLGTIRYNNPLPVELLEYKASCATHGVTLQWNTASETNNAYFNIERSTDAANWTVIAQIDGAGNSNQITNYLYTDENVSNTTTYYRLKQTDFDGNFQYFTPVSVNCGTENEEMNIAIYPNPFKEVVNLDVSQFGYPQAQVVIYDVLGNKLLKQEFTLIENNSFSASFDMKKIACGVYFVEVTAKDFKKNFKIVKN